MRAFRCNKFIVMIHPRSFRQLGLIWPLLCVAALQALLLVASLDLLASLRAGVDAQGLWDKARLMATYRLSRYLDTQDAGDYQRFLAALATPLGDRDARLALEAPVIDTTAVYAGIIAGGSHPGDAARVSRLFRYFGNIDPVCRAIRIWRETDGPLLDLRALGQSVHGGIEAGRASREQFRLWQNQLDAIDARLLPMSDAFSRALRDSARGATRWLVVLNLGLGVCLVLTGLVVARKLRRQRQDAETALASEKERAEITLASIGEAVLTIDELGCIRYMNPAGEQLTAWSSEAALHTPLGEIFHLRDSKNAPIEGAQLVQLLLEGQSHASGALELERRDATRVAVSLVAAPIRRRGLTTGAVLVFHDMTREHQFVADLSWQATHDALTGLVNRREFDTRLRRGLERIAEQGGSHALLYLDIDQFKLVNDTTGHAAGDELLCQAARHLKYCLRERDTLARLGGDEFGILLEHCTPDAALLVAEKLRCAIETLHFSAGGPKVTTSASVGLVCIEPMQFQPEEAMRAADLACYLAKEKGRNRVQVYSAENADLSRRFKEMLRVQQLQEALRENRFRLYAQSVVPVRPDRANEGSHVELLLRMIDDSGQIVSPGEFIPAAERFGMMPQIDRWVVQKAFAMLVERRRQGREPMAFCAINLSGATIGEREFLTFLRTELARHELDPSTLCFEVTETVAIANFSEANSFIGELQALGCRFALDDFGAGMSSFAYLRQLPVDYVKIDGSFVKDMLRDPINYAMVEMICDMAHLMGKRTIAEFVESAEIFRALGGIGVDYAQGYAIGKPEPFDAYIGVKARAALGVY